MDAKRILERLKGDADRERTSLYLSRSTMEEFKQACLEMAPSRVMEELMKNFIASSKLPQKSDNLSENDLVLSLARLADYLGYEIKKKSD